MGARVVILGAEAEATDNLLGIVIAVDTNDRRG